MTDEDLKQIRTVLKEELEPVRKTLDGHGEILEEHTQKLEGITAQLLQQSKVLINLV